MVWHGTPQRDQSPAHLEAMGMLRGISLRHAEWGMRGGRKLDLQWIDQVVMVWHPQVVLQLGGL